MDSIVKSLKKNVLLLICCTCALSGYILIDNKNNTARNDNTVSDTTAAKKINDSVQAKASDSGAIPFGSLQLPAVNDSADTYTLQLGSYISEGAAHTAAKSFDEAMYKTGIMKVKDQSGGIQFVLTTGKFTSRHDAEQESNILRCEYLIGNKIIRLPPAAKK
jgi:hypothetical protein